MTLEDFKNTMLYITISFYHDDWYHSYIEQEDDEGKLRHFLFEVDNDGEHFVQVDHYDQRMYPYGAKSEKIMSKYTLYKWNSINSTFTKIKQDFGSDWIGF
jgi:hypothetical protein